MPAAEPQATFTTGTARLRAHKGGRERRPDAHNCMVVQCRYRCWYLTHLVRDEHDGLVAEQALDAVVEDVVRRVVVHGRQRVVQQHQVALGVGAAGQVDALPLAAAEVDAADAGPAVRCSNRGRALSAWYGGCTWGSSALGTGPLRWATNTLAEPSSAACKHAAVRV